MTNTLKGIGVVVSPCGEGDKKALNPQSNPYSQHSVFNLICHLLEDHITQTTFITPNRRVCMASCLVYILTQDHRSGHHTYVLIGNIQRHSNGGEAKDLFHAKWHRDQTLFG